MKTVTHGKTTFGKTIVFVTIGQKTGELGLTCVFASEDGNQNAAEIHMTAAEARNYARQLSAMADKLDLNASAKALSKVLDALPASPEVTGKH